MVAGAIATGSVNRLAETLLTLIGEEEIRPTDESKAAEMPLQEMLGADPADRSIVVADVREPRVVEPKSHIDGRPAEGEDPLDHPRISQ
jgi:hypothetical protein